MQRLTFDMIGTRSPLTVNDSEIVRLRMNSIGYLDPSIILRTDSSVKVSIDKNVYTISTNVTLITESHIVSSSGTIILNKLNLGIQEVLVNMDTELDPAFGELMTYSTNNNIISLNTNDYNGKTAYIKYLTTN